MGPIEFAAVHDLDELRALEVLPPATDALQASFLALAMAMDSATDSGDDELGHFLASLPSTPRGRPA